VTDTGLGRSGIREVMDLAASLDGVVHLELGEPDFPTPLHVVEAVQRALTGGQVKYTLSRGEPELRELIAAKLEAVNGISRGADGVVVTPGGTAAVFGALSALVRPGDAVLLPDPGWPTFEMVARLVSAEIRRYRLTADRNFEPDPDELDRLARGARVLVLNTPSNPTGAVFSPSAVESALEVALRHGLDVISDEVYEQIVLDGSHTSATALDPDGRVIGIFSFSKDYAMTGWRIGYLTARRDVVEAVVRVQEAAAACPSWPGQRAAVAALTGPQHVIGDMVDEYRRRRDVAVELLDRVDLLAARPRGTFYVLARVGGVELDTYEFARRLLQEERIAVAPGETFGPGGAGLVRLSLASPPEAIAAGVEALERVTAAAASGEDGRRG
jgi:aspartate/methionine/tyrosine aminotransferase